MKSIDLLKGLKDSVSPPGIFEVVTPKMRVNSIDFTWSEKIGSPNGVSLGKSPILDKSKAYSNVNKSRCSD